MPSRCWPASRVRARVRSALTPRGSSEAVVQVLAALLSPPMGEPSPERLQEYHHRARSNRVYYDALDRRYNQLDNLVNAIPSLPLRWKSSIYGRRLWRHYPKTKVAPHSPLNPAILLRNFQIQFVIGFLDRVGIRPLGKSRVGLSHRGRCAWHVRIHREAHLWKSASRSRCGNIQRPSPNAPDY